MIAWLRRTLWLWPAALVGAAIRLWRLHDQILADDELHTVHAVLTTPLPEILHTYRPSDACLPLSGLFRIWVDTGHQLTELVLRAPTMLCGLLLLLVAPLWVERWLGRREAVAFAWLAALSPPLVFYSRIARSYLPMVLLGAVAAVAFWAWWTSDPGRRRWAWGGVFAAAAALCLWVHPGSGTFLAAPFAWFAGEWGWRRLRGRGTDTADPPTRGFAIAAGPPAAAPPGLAAAVALGLGFTALSLLFLIPGWASLSALVSEKRLDHMEVPFHTVTQVLRLASGSPHAVLTWIFWILALVGLGILLRRRPLLATFSAALAVGHVVGVRWLEPVGLPQPLVFHRYVLIALPVVLLWVAVAALVGLATLAAATRIPRSSDAPWRRWLPKALGWTPVALLLVVWLATGPLLRWSYLWGSFAHSNAFLLYSTPGPRFVPDGPRSDVYRRLAEEPGEGVVLEVPWFWFWNTHYTYPLAQRLHGRDTVVGSELPEVADERTAFRNLVEPNPWPLLASRARFLVVHKDFVADEDRVVAAGWQALGRDPAPEVTARLQELAADLERIAFDHWGAPWYEDATVTVWDLAAAREEMLARQAR